MTTTTIEEPHQLIPVANRILVAHGILDAYGHVSMRDPRDPGHFWIARNMAPLSVQPEDLQRLDLDGTTPDERRSYLEVFIHSEIYRARPDVQAVVHTHAPVVVPYSIVDTPMQCVSHMAGFLAPGVPTFEIRDTLGDDTDLLITGREGGRALARTLGDAAVALMRGHGAVIVGASVPEVVHRAVFTAFNARVLTDAATIGGHVTPLTEAEGRAAMVSNQGQIRRGWDLWSAQVEQ
jgi:HCOMODA/2-hydroxy-3-carboxy-muconic semialdehyde decarboxylase